MPKTDHGVPVSFFSSPSFLRTVGETVFAGRHAAIETCETEGHQFDLLSIDQRPVVELRFLDFVEPNQTQQYSGVRRVRYIPRASIERASVDGWLSRPIQAGVSPSPLIDWRRFPSWEDYRRFTADRAFQSQTARKLKKVERDLGPVRFVFHDARPELVSQCIAWKRAQYQSSGFPDAFGASKWRDLFFALLSRQALTVSALYAGDRVLAIHMGAVLDGRMYCWIPAYDAALRSYSPGLALLERMIEHSYRAGHREFDFLIGGEPYKFNYATDVRIVAAIGLPPLRQRVWSRLRRRVMVEVGRYPRVHAQLQSAKRFLLARA